MSRNSVQLNPVLNRLARDTPCKWYSSAALFQPPLPEPDRPVSRHPALQAWNIVCLDCLFPCGSRHPPHSRGHFHSPATLHLVLGIAPGIGLLRPLCHHEGHPLVGGPEVPTESWSVLRNPLGGYPAHCRRLWRGYLPTLRLLIGNSIHRFSPSLRGGQTTRPAHLGSTLSLSLYGLVAQRLENGWYLSLYLLPSCSCPLVPFGPRLDGTLVTSTLVTLDYPNKDLVGASAHGELSLSGDPECLSLQTDGSTHVPERQEGGCLPFFPSTPSNGVGFQKGLVVNWSKKEPQPIRHSLASAQ